MTTTENPKPRNRLAELAQRNEADFVIFKVCDRIRKENPKCFIATIHDSILMVAESVDFVLGIMRDEFEKLGVRPRLEAATV